MTAETGHIAAAYDEELESLNALMTAMGTKAEDQLALALRAVADSDDELARKVYRQDRQLDDLEQEINIKVTRILALRQPMANDLRAILAALKISADIERIGDHTKSIAKRVSTLNQLPTTMLARGGLPRIGRPVQAMVRNVLDAYLKGDAALALDVWESDEEVDGLYTSLFRELLTYMMEDHRQITACAHLLFIAKNLERIGDHATNIAEIIYFQVEGTRLTDKRPKADASKYAVVMPDAPASGAD